MITMKNIAFYHIALSVSNLEKMTSWYENLLGFKRITPTFTFGETSKYCFLELNGFKLELVENKLSKPFKRESPPAHSLLHGVTQFSFKVNELRGVSDFMKANNVEIIVDNFVVEEVKTKILIVKDPDGNLVEFVEAI